MGCVLVVHALRYPPRVALGAPWETRGVTGLGRRAEGPPKNPLKRSTHGRQEASQESLVQTEKEGPWPMNIEHLLHPGHSPTNTSLASQSSQPERCSFPDAQCPTGLPICRVQGAPIIGWILPGRPLVAVETKARKLLSGIEGRSIAASRLESEHYLDALLPGNAGYLGVGSRCRPKITAGDAAAVLLLHPSWPPMGRRRRRAAACGATSDKAWGIG